MKTKSQKFSIYKDIKNFDSFGENTKVETIDGIDYFINEFWTSKQRQAHRLHEVSYRACFKPQLPAFFIDRLTNQGDVVYDPFMGRGTTLIESALKQRVPFGNDVNPLSSALTEPRLNTPTLEEVKTRLLEIPFSSFSSIENEDLLVFFHPNTLKKIEGLKNWLIDREKSQSLDMVDKWIRMVAINRLTGHSKGFFSVYSLPPNQAVSIERQKLINLKRNQIPDERNVQELIIKKSKSLLSHGGIVAKKYKLLSKDSSSTKNIKDHEVSLTVTSPPFLDIVNYESDNWLRCWFLNIDPNTVKITSHKKIEDWTKFTSSTLKELSRITKPGGYVVYEVGEVRKGSIRLEKNVIDAAENLPFKLLGVMVNTQKFTKTSNVWGISNNSIGTNSNRIVLFERV